MTPVVLVENLKAYYSVSVYGLRRTIKAVDGVSLTINKDEILGIAGESGCGKSTLMKVLLGLLRPPLKVFEGKVLYNIDNSWKNILVLSEKELDEFKWKMFSYIPQGSMSVLNPTRKLAHTFFDFIEPHLKKFNKEEVKEMIVKHLEKLDLPPRVLNTYPHQLSGGMKQRIVIALATILKPKIIFADEPTTALDVVVQRDVIQLLKSIQCQEKNSIVFISHDMAVHASLSTRIAIMYAGKIIEEAETREIFKNPLHPYTKFLIDSLPRIGTKEYRKSTPGVPPSLANPPSGCRFHPRCPHAMEICKEKEPDMMEIREGHKVACFLYR